MLQVNGEEDTLCSFRENERDDDEHAQEHDNMMQQTSSQKVAKETNRHQIPDQILLPKSAIVIQDMCATLEHVLLNGGRVPSREKICNEFLDSDSVLGSAISSSGDRGCTSNGHKRRKRNSNTAGDDRRSFVVRHHDDDMKLYKSVVMTSNQGGKSPMLIPDRYKQGQQSQCGKWFHEPYNPYEDDDIEIPNEFLMKPHATTKSDAAGTTVSRIHQQQEDCISMIQKSMPLDDPVKYNNSVRERHS